MTAIMEAEDIYDPISLHGDNGSQTLYDEGQMAPGNPVVSALKELFMTVVQHQTEIMINHAQQQETILEQRRVSQRLLENMCESIGHQMGNVNAVMGGKVDDETLQALVAARDSIQPPAPSHVEYVLQVAGEQARHPATGFVPFARRREFSAEDTLRHDNYDEDTRVAELFRNHGNSFSHREDGWYWQDRMMGFANRQGPTPSSHGNPHRHSYGSLSDSPPRFHGHLMTPSEVSRRPKGAWSGENLYSHTIDTRLTENIIKATNRVSKEVLQAILLEVLNAVPDIHKGNLHDHVLNMVRGREGPQNYPLRSSHWPVTVSPGVGYMGYFKLPIECVGSVLKYLSLKEIKTFLMNTCKSLRALFGDARIWSDVVFDSRGSFVKFDVFKLFLRRLPEGSIRKLTIDSNLIEPAKVSDLMEILMHTKQWRITSIHAVGKKLNSTMLTKIVKGLWSEDIKVLSIHDVIVSKMDVVTAAKCCLNMTGLNKIRMEGDVHLLALKTLAGQRPDSGGIAGNNSITHLSFCVRSALTWDNIIHFGEWFPHLEALFTHTILGESEKWRLKYGTILEDDSTTFTCKHPEPEEMGWKAMIGLKSFGVEILCDTKAAREFVCTYENVHTAFLWALVKGSADSLRRLELNNRGFEGKGKLKVETMSTGYFRLIPKFSASSVEQVALPRLEYLFLGRWILQWDSFVRPITTDLPSSSVAPFIEGHPHLSIPAIKMVALHNCQGYPNGVVGLNGKHEGDEDVDMGEEGKLTMRWLSELRNVWPLVNGKDGVVDSVMGNIGTGSW